MLHFNSSSIIRYFVQKYQVYSDSLLSLPTIYLNTLIQLIYIKGTVEITLRVQKEMLIDSSMKKEKSSCVLLILLNSY